MQQKILFNKYRIIKLLGRGGTARVYLAEHIKLKSYRAIKSISKKHPLYELQRKEAFILKSIKHSCVPIIYDIEEDENCSYIIEEYLQGVNLKDFSNKGDKLGEHIIIQFIIQICSLIQYLHTIDRPILYLDLKPENIMVCGTMLKLIDFGSAVFQDELTSESLYLGTKGFAAPELYKQNIVDERSDVYGIGMLLFYLVSGNDFKQNETNMLSIDSVVSCSKKLKVIINRCLKYNPSQRYGSVSQLSKHLSGVIGKKGKLTSNSNSTIRIAIAGAQTRIGVTHLAFSICNYYIQKKTKCLYIEKNNSKCVWSMLSRYETILENDGVYKVLGVPMSWGENSELIDLFPYKVLVEDYGCLANEKLSSFLEADVSILVLGGKDWELTFSEQVLDIVAEYKEVYYLFNYMDGSQYQQVMKSMEKRNCHRIPYHPNPFAIRNDSKISELIKELTFCNEKIK